MVGMKKMVWLSADNILIFLQYLHMTPEQLIQKLRSESQSSTGVTQAILGQLKKYFDELKNNLATTPARPQETYAFKERVIGYLLNSLNKHSHSPKEKIQILEILERDLISSKHNVPFFNRLYNYLVEQDENVGIQACKTIDALIKQINEGQQASANPTFLDTKQHYLKLFQFLKERTEFLLRLSEHVRQPQFRCFRRASLDEKERQRQRDKEKEKEKKDTIFKNSKSLKFINQVPHLFIHLMAYVDTGSRSQDEDIKIRDLIRKSIDNIVQALKKTPYDQFYNEFNWQFNNELFGVMTKLLQFLFINLRSDKDQSGNKSNQNLKKHISDQIEHIKVPEVIKNFIHLLKNCSQDFQLNRYQIVNRLKLLLNNLDKGKLNKNDAIQIMGEILNEQTIFGRKKIIGDYSKNAICSFWLEMIRSPVLMTNIFPQALLSLRTASQQTHLNEQSPEITQCFIHIQKLVQEVLKTIFDNTFYPSVQEKCIELLTYLIDQLFPDGSDSPDMSMLNSTSGVAKKIQENKLKILLRILDCTSLKLQSIKHIFEQIDDYVIRKMGHRPSKKELPQPLKLQHMQLSSLEPSVAESKNWGRDAVDFVENCSEQIDNSLLTLSVVQNKFITIYEEEDELCFNSHPVKLNNYTLYLKQVKTKLLEKCITLAHKITKTFLSQNIQMYTPFDINSLKTIYFILSNKRALTSDQCKVLASILKNGLRIFEILHLYDLHSDDQTNKKGHLKNFMLIFAQIYDPVNFRDIFEPNMNQFFHNLINYAKNCADYCLQFVLIEPYCSNSNQAQPFNKNIVELLTYNLILRLQSTSDQLDPFHEFYSYRQEYFLLLQKLIRFPFRCLSRYSDESFIRNYFRQIILFLTKKAHTSRFCLDYLHLMRTLFKNILFNSNRQAASPLFSQFYAICCRNAQNIQGQTNSHSVFINVNILDNFLKFYETGIPELADIVTELVIMLPLKSKHIIQFAKQGYIVKPLLHCLCLMSDYNYLLRTLKTFQIIISHSTAQQISLFLDGLKDKLINRLFEMVLTEFKTSDLKPQKINNDLSSLSLKLLAKLGALSRNRDPTINPLPKALQHPPGNELKLILQGPKGKFQAPIGQTVQYAIQVFHKLLDSFYQSIIFVSMQMIEKSFELLVSILPVALQKMNPLAERILGVFSAILALSSKYLTISPTILNHIREQVKTQIKKYSDAVKEQFMTSGLTQYCRFFIKALISNLSQRVLITREENFIKQISQEPKKFLWGLVLDLIQGSKGTQTSNELIQFVIRLLISGCLQLKNPHQIRLNVYQNDYNHVLPFKNAALNALSQMIDLAPKEVLQEVYPDVLQTAFVAASTIPDILNLKIMKHPRTIVKKIYKFILRDEKVFLQNFKTAKMERVFSYILDNLVGYSVEAHQMAMQFMQMIMKQTKLNLHQLFYAGQSWENICDGLGTGYHQSQYSLSDFSSWKEKNRQMYPIVPLIRNLLRIAHNINEETLRSHPNQLKMLHNCFATFQLLISIKSGQKNFQAFQMLLIPKEQSDDGIAFNQTFKKIISVALQTITINDKIYQNFTKIIIQQPSAPAATPNPAASNPPVRPGAAPTAPAPARRQGLAASGTTNPSPNNPAFNINTNTFIDDEEYGLNIQDLDMQVKAWGKLIASILRFLKSILLNNSIFSISKNMQKRKLQRSKLIQTRLEIIFKMFELIGRVDKQVRQTAYECLRELLSHQQHPKDLIQNDQKLKHILRPVLISLQLQFKKFTPSFLLMFQKILKLLTQCFNITLIQKLVDKLRQMQKAKQQQFSAQSKSLPNPPQPIKHLNYSQITLQTKCIANFLALFQYLGYAYHNHRSANFTVNSMILIFKYVSNICNYFTNKLGKYTIRTHIKTTLARVLNTMCQKLSGQAIFVDGHQRQLDLENSLEVISLEDSFPLRQKLTRQTSYIDKALTQISRSKTKKDYITFLEIVYVLAKSNSRWLKGFVTLGQRLIRELGQAINARLNFKYQQKHQIELNDKSEIVVISKILLEYIKQNDQDLKALFALVGVFKLRGSYDFHFVKTYLKYGLYDHTSPQIKRQIMLQFLSMVRSSSSDSEKVIAISQNIIYHFILIEVNAPQDKRQILIDNQDILRTLADSIKYCLNPRNLHNRGLSQVNFRQSANNYRIAIQILQLSNLALAALKNILSETNRSSILLTVWGLLRMEDKIIKNYAFVWTSNYIRTFDNFDSNKSLGLYLTLIRALESLAHGDYEIGALIKKALNIMIPYWDSRGPPTGPTSWIDWSLKAVHDQSNQPNKLVRFWEIVVKNHSIFNKYKQSKFETQMVNSMQWLMVANNPTSTNPLVKKIASDMSFIYIEWKYKEAKSKLAKTPKDCKVVTLEQANNDRAAQICLNFFIKVALNNSSDKDDKQIMKRSLYLLKKTLILWPNTKKKFDAIKTVVNKLKSTNIAGMQSSEMPLRFHFTLLNIIHILLLYEPDHKLLPQLTGIFKLLQLGGHIVPPPRFAANPHAQQGNTIFTMNNIYLLNLLCSIVKRLVKVAATASEKDQQGQKLMQEIHAYIRDGFQYHLLTGNRMKNGPSNLQMRAQQLKKIQIQVAICFLKILYDVDPKNVDTHLNYIKQVTSSLKKMFEKGFETSSKSSSPNKVYELPQLTQGSFPEMLEKDLEIAVELIKPDQMYAAEENYERDNIKSYATRRPLFVILLRILASKFNSIAHSEDQTNILDILLSIYEKIPDPELKIEVINILKCMFIGKAAWTDGIIPARYQQIGVINYPVRKLFHLLFQDSNKFNEHFQRRKSKPSDQNYNINERIYQEITTKIYFNFLCQFIITLPEHQLVPSFLSKIKQFVLFAVKVVDAPLLDQILAIIDHSYHRNNTELYVNLFEDYKELNCIEQNLQGDEISLFFTYYLYHKALQYSQASVYGFGQKLPQQFSRFYLNYLKSDVASPLHTQGLLETLKLSMKVLPQSKNLPKVLSQYLLNGSYNDSWGTIVLKVALDRHCLGPDQLYKIASNINEYGILLKQLQGKKLNLDMPMLDFAYRAYGDRDLIYGYRLNRVTSPSLRMAIMKLQQRQYVNALQALQNHCENRTSQRLKRAGVGQQAMGQGLMSFHQTMNDSLVTDIAKQCFKNLNQWQDIIDHNRSSKNGSELDSTMQYLFHSNGNRQNINNVLNDLQKLGPKHFPFYYGKSVINFLQSPGGTVNKQLSIALLYALLEWLSFPKNARHNHNRMLVKIQCLLELQQGQKIKQQSSSGNQQQPSLVDALTKVVQSVYTQINSWRQRMPDKYQDLWSWQAILGQRIMIYEFMKSKMVSLLDNVVRNQNMYTQKVITTTHTQKLLIPYTDIQWNKLRLIKQQRYFDVYNPPHLYRINPQNLYFDEHLIYTKQQFFHYFTHAKDPAKALEILDALLKDHKEQGQRDQQLFRMQKLQVARLKANTLSRNQLLNHANTVFIQSVRGVQQHLLPLWRDWLVSSLKAYQKDKNVQYAQQALAILPYAIRYKTHKTKLILGPVLKLLQERQSDPKIQQTLSRIMQIIPIKPFLIWLPQVLKLADKQVRNNQQNEAEEKDKSHNHMFKILEKLSIYYPQSMYYIIKQFFRLSEYGSIRDAFLNIKKVYYNLVTKLQIFSQLIVQIHKQQKVSIHILGSLTRAVSQLHMPLFQNWRGELQPQSIPTISQISQELQIQKINSQLHKVMVLLGSDGKEYRYRLQKMQKQEDGAEFQKLLMSQTFEITNSHLHFWRQASIRKLKLYEQRSTVLISNQQAVKIWKSSHHTVTPLDILNQFLDQQTSYTSRYPQCDKQLQRLPTADRDQKINKRMKQIVPQDLLRRYLSSKTTTYDDFFTLRRTLADQYGAMLCLNYALSIDTHLKNFMINLSNGHITVLNLPYNLKPNQESPFSVRLSRSIFELFGTTYVNAGVLPSFIATADALCNIKLNFKAYLDLLYQQLQTEKVSSSSNLFARITQVSQSYELAMNIMRIATQIGKSRNVPTNHKYWC